MAIPTREMFESFYKDHEWIVEEELEKFKYTYIESERAELIETVTNWYSKRQSYLKKLMSMNCSQFLKLNQAGNVQ